MARLARTSGMVGALLLSACATTKTVDPQSALAGKQLDAAVSLYGPYGEQRLVGGHDVYIWRRSIVVEGQPYACELSAEIGYRQIIRTTSIEGNMGACRAFWITFTSASDVRKADALKAAEAKAARPRTANYRPVGRTPATTTADVSGANGRGAE